MKAKTINAVLCKVMDQWAASIEDEAVRKAVKDNTIITGGCIASMLLREKVNDYDIYFRNIDTAEMVARYYVEQFKKNPPPKFAGGGEIDISVLRTADRVKVIVKSAGIASEDPGEDYRYFEANTIDPTAAEPDEYVEEQMAVVAAAKDDDGARFRPIFLTSNAITLSHNVQVVLRFQGEPDQLHENYDFVHCTNYWDSKERKLTLRPAALEALLARELRYVGSKYPLCSIIRTRKFIQRQWTVNAGQYLKMVMQLQTLNLNDPKVLEDQLIGVDFAYFNEIIRKVMENDPEKVNTAYLVEIIDRMF